jgi:lipopolysaccharide export system protein LptA
MATLRFSPRAFKLLCCVGLWSLSWASAVCAQTVSKSAAAEEPLPLNITADRLEVEQNQQVITFIKNVVARYKDMILHADLLKIFYQSNTQPAPDQGKPGSRQCPPGQETPASLPPQARSTPPGTEASPLGAVGIEKIIRIEALGNVRIVQGDRVATGDKAIYYTQEEKIVLMGNPQLWRGDNSLKGHEIIFYVQENRAVVAGDPGKRVEAVIYPSQKMGPPGSKLPGPTPKK